MYMLVSHRNMISIYDMSKSHGPVYGSQGNKDVEHGRWVQTVAFDEGVLKKIRIVKRSKAERVAIQR